MSRQIELRHLRYFIAVAEELNFRRAAERLFISQPPLSRQISALEALLGVRLLERDTANVRLTTAGKLALGRSRKLLAEVARFADDMRAAERPRRPRLRAAVSIAVSPTLLPALESGWKKALAVDAIDVETGSSKQLLPRLRRQAIDFALLGSPNDFHGLESLIVQTVPVVVALPAHHVAAGKRAVALADLNGLPLFWFARSFNPPYYDHCAAVFAAAGFKPSYIHVPPGQLTTLERIGAGEGMSLLTRAQAQARMKGVVYRPLREGQRLGISVVAVWKPDPSDPLPGIRARAMAAVARRILAAAAGHA
ncbi:MAG TPA: LysR family transcriptional regulator [Burkholderiaceae bacterium]|nr:LysR family transcriptional regulator [Burkholderiaceae bacterium]